nr:hypothetical protein [Polaribacter pectinis]
MKANGKTTEEMVKGFTIGKMEINMKEVIQKEKEKVKEHIILNLVKFT